MSAVNTEQRDRHYEKTKRTLVAGAAIIATGLAVAGSVDRTTGGVIVLVGWIAGVLGLHGLGRAGSSREPEEKKKSAD